MKPYLKIPQTKRDWVWLIPMKQLLCEGMKVMFKTVLSQAPVAHFCNSSYSRGKDQQDLGLKPDLDK
jgi:hypothetical protein